MGLSCAFNLISIPSLAHDVTSDVASDPASHPASDPASDVASEIELSRCIFRSHSLYRSAAEREHVVAGWVGGEHEDLRLEEKTESRRHR